MQIPSNNSIRRALAGLVGLLVWTGCAAQLDWPEHRVNVTVAFDQLDAEQPFTTADGTQLRVEQLGITIWSATLERCEGTETPTAGAWERLKRLATTPTAVAHGSGGPTILAEPLVLQLAPGDGRTRELGTLQPPSDRYCSLAVLIKAADADARDLPEMSSMKGHSAIARGEVWRDDTWHRYDWTTTRTTEATLVFDEPLVLETDADTATSLRLQLEARTWFDGVDFSGPTDQAQAAFLRNIREQPTLEVSR